MGFVIACLGMMIILGIYCVCGAIERRAGTRAGAIFIAGFFVIAWTAQYCWGTL
jgi:hypothetical protein